MKLIVVFVLLFSFLHAKRDVTKNVEIVSSPYSNLYKGGEFIYARNIWDMQVFNGMLFIGAGNSNNFKPAPNAGRVPVFSFNPKTDKFTNEYTVAEEQIDRFRVIENKLYIPGHDATQKWDFGNFYTRTESGKWNKYRSIPNALHVYDIAKDKQKLFTALGLNNRSAVGTSIDNGKSWDIQKTGASYSRVYSFLKVKDVLYSCKSFTPIWHRNKYWSEDRKKDYYSIGEYNGEKFKERFDLTVNKMFPSTSLHLKKTKKIIHSESIGNKSIYIGAYIHNNGHQGIPFGAYVVNSLTKGKIDIQRIKLAKNYKPWDIIVRDTKVYLLCYDESNSKVIVLYANHNRLNKWKELFSFSSSAFARSFELLNGDFYFGIGCKIGNSKTWKQSELSPDTGNILRVKKK